MWKRGWSLTVFNRLNVIKAALLELQSDEDLNPGEYVLDNTHLIEEPSQPDWIYINPSMQWGWVIQNPDTQE